jgi:hypothetical protein
VHVVFSNARIRFAFATQPKLDIALDARRIVQAVRQLKFERTPVAHVDH